jgi:hypothetical protein
VERKEEEVELKEQSEVALNCEAQEENSYRWCSTVRHEKRAVIISL